ncbi:MAG: glutamate-1-semialdehyde 2,1-aminomutase [Candidatus Marsarchaeota archaeon]|nr:glutamate-1-semialdehyde 2,1-aminomutase [Candidatus Marsarchaeota archaeon]
MPLSQSKISALHERAHKLIPAGCHTYSKGDDQFPSNAPPFLARGEGAYVWDLAGEKYIDWGMGLRSVLLGHAYPRVVEAVKTQLAYGSNFIRPHLIESEVAETMARIIPSAEMVKFAKNGSDVTTAAVKLARAHTGRDLILYCKDHPFFSVNDWFIGTTACNAGVPQAIQDLSIPFRYNQPETLKEAFDKYKDRIACVIMEPVTGAEPKDNFLSFAREIAHKNGAVFILDEMITGFRFSLHGAQSIYKVKPDLCTFGKALTNGFSVSALCGKAEIMERGGLRHKKERVFLLSLTHGAEIHSFAAAQASLAEYEEKKVSEAVARQGQKLQDGFRRVIGEQGLSAHMSIDGFSCSPILNFKEADGSFSFVKKTLFMQEMVKQHVLMPYLAPSFSHTDAVVEETVAAFAKTAPTLKGWFDSPEPKKHLVGEPVKPVFRKYN